MPTKCLRALINLPYNSYKSKSTVYETERKWKKNKKTSVQVLDEHSQNEGNAKLKKKIYGYLYHLLRGMILIWYFFMLGTLFSSYLSLMSKLKSKFFIYCVHFWIQIPPTSPIVIFVRCCWFLYLKSKRHRHYFAWIKYSMRTLCR